LHGVPAAGERLLARDVEVRLRITGDKLGD